MSKKKQLIYALVLIACLVASGVILYKGFFAAKTAQPVLAPVSPANMEPPAAGSVPTSGAGLGTMPSPAPSDASGKILPYGTSLNFSTLDKYTAESQSFAYPTVKPEEVGDSLQNLIGGK